MAGNNSCGAKSIRYGLMADNVLGIDAMLADGSRFHFGELPDNLGADVPAGIADLIQRLRALGAREAEEIAARFPTQLRRVGGYNLDALTPAARAAGRGNLARLLVGSEGRLAFSAALDLKLWPIKPRKVLGICQFPTFRAAMEAARHLVTLDPEAVELVDRTMIDLGRSIPIYRATIDRMVRGEPDSLLIVEFHGHEEEPLLRGLDRLEEMMADLGHPDAVVRATDAGFQAAIAEVREAGLNIMMSMKGDGKPVSFIEDCAVDLDHLADFTERLNEVFARHGTKGTWYAHASVGCLHVRPVLNMKDPAEVRTMRAIAEECFALVREYKGSHSGEHGDGIVRSRVQRADVRRPHRPRLRGGEGRLRPGRACSTPAAWCARRSWMTAACSATARTTQADPERHAGARLVGLAGPAGRAARRGRDVQQQRHLPQAEPRRDVPELPGHAQRARPDARAGQHLAPRADRPARAGGAGLGRGGGGAVALRLLQGVQARMPDRRRHGQDEDRGPARAGQGARHLGQGPADRRACRAGRPSRRGCPSWPTRGTRCRASPPCPSARSASPPDAACPASAATPSATTSCRRPTGREGEVILYPDPFNRYFEPENLRAAVAGAPGGRLRAGAGPAAAGPAPARQRPHLPRRRAWWRRRGPRRGGRWRRSAASARRWSASSPPTC